MKIKPSISAAMLLAVTCAIIGATIPDFLRVRKTEPIVKGPGVTGTKLLSDYFPGLKGTGGDTDVYVMDSGKPGATIVVLGGTHPPEVAPVVACALFIENAVVSEGKVIVIPHANESGFTCTEPGQGHPQYFYVKTDHGDRAFRFGCRATNPVDQWPDPDMYKHYPSGQVLAADEIRNLDRAYPGKPDGLLTQKVAYGIIQLVKQEKAAMIFDQHEAPPEKPLVDAICVHERALDLATIVCMELESQGIHMRLEVSPKDLHGYSHREIGDATDALAILSETSNPAQGSVRGRTTPELVVSGNDPMYESLFKSKKLSIAYVEGGERLENRVGRDVANVCQFAKSWTEMYSDRPVIIENMPSYADLQANGIGKYLLPVK
jgi:hypothetical protein